MQTPEQDWQDRAMSQSLDEDEVDQNEEAQANHCEDHPADGPGIREAGEGQL